MLRYKSFLSGTELFRLIKRQAGKHGSLCTCVLLFHAILCDQLTTLLGKLRSAMGRSILLSLLLLSKERIETLLVVGSQLILCSLQFADMLLYLLMEKARRRRGPICSNLFTLHGTQRVKIGLLLIGWLVRTALLLAIQTVRLDFAKA
ncbi:hypothetical protein KC316_g40 [Hortaea werneckii]|nr:hypothetical protein KC316_g40 [Hortaea werneckii]